jgi:tetratricopeptide (TPR) repeat protein
VEDLLPSQLYRAGISALDRGDLTRAEQYFSSALHAGYDARASVRALLKATVRASRLRSALLYATPYLLTHPRDVGLRQLVACLHFALGQLPQAEAELTRALAVQEESPEAHYLLALVLARSGADSARSRSHWARYLALSPAGPHAEEARDELANAGAGSLP